MSTASASYSASYVSLLDDIKPRIIHTQEENDRAIAGLYDLDQLKHRSPEQEDIAALLTMLIEKFEEEHYALPASSPIDMISFLLDQRGLKQKDLGDLLGGTSVVSEIMTGKRSLTLNHIVKLADRFNVPRSLFVPERKSYLDEELELTRRALAELKSK